MSALVVFLYALAVACPQRTRVHAEAARITGRGLPVQGDSEAGTGRQVGGGAAVVLDPPRRGRRARYCLALSTVMVLLAAVSGLITTFAGPLAGYALHLG